MFDRCLGTILREYRTRAGLSQEELSFRADIHRTYVSFVERGKRSISLKIFVRWCQAVDADPKVVMGELLETLEQDE